MIISAIRTRFLGQISDSLDFGIFIAFVNITGNKNHILSFLKSIAGNRFFFFIFGNNQEQYKQYGTS
jgi:hypothetical protein